MLLTKRTEIARRDIDVDGLIHVQVATVFEEDGVEKARAVHRYFVEPGDDFTARDEAVKRLAQVEHTPERVQKYKDKQAEIAAKRQNP